MKRLLILMTLLMMTAGTTGCRSQCGGSGGLLPRFDWLRGRGTSDADCDTCESGPVYSSGYSGGYEGVIMAPSMPLLPGPVQTLPNPS